MSLVHPAEDISLSAALHREVNMLLQAHIQMLPQARTMYGCPQCSLFLPSMDDFKKHMQIAHPKTQDAVCKICHKRYKSEKSLRRHEKTHQKSVSPVEVSKKVPDFPCLQCPKKLNTQTALYWHVERNHTDTGKNSTCQVCGKGLANHGILKRHLETMHSLETAHCMICKKIFKSAINLQRHMTITHAPEDAVQTCEICNKTFKCKTHLRIHVQTVHSTDTVFKCDICSKEFLVKKYMLKHRKIHVDVREFPCKICSNVFKSPADAKRHEQRVHMKKEHALKLEVVNHKCDVCNKEFTRRKYLLFHKNTHLDKTLSCELCSKLFKCPSHVQKHTKRVHENCVKNKQTVFHCDICNKSFNKKKNLVKHIKLHMILTKEFPCDICSKFFKTNSDVNKHLRRVHMKNMNIKDMTMIKKNLSLKTIHVNKSNTKASLKTRKSMETRTESDEHVIKNFGYTEDVLESPNDAIKVLEITAYTDEVSKSEDYRLATVENTECPVKDIESREFCLENLASTEQVIESKGFLDEALGTQNTEVTEHKEIGEVHRNTEFVEKAIEKEYTDEIKETLASAEFLEKEDSKRTELIKVSQEADKFQNTGYRDKTQESELIETLSRVKCNETTVTKLEDKYHSSTDIIKAAIESVDFTLEDLGMTNIADPAVNNCQNAEETLRHTDLITGFEMTQTEVETTNCIPIRNIDIIKQAIQKSDFTLEDFEISEDKEEGDINTRSTKVLEATQVTNDAIANTVVPEVAIVNTEFDEDDLRNADFMEVFESEGCVKEVDLNPGNTNRKGVIESSNLIEDLEITEYVESHRSTEYSIEEFGITDETVDSTKFTEGIIESVDETVSRRNVKETPASTEIVEAVGSKDIVGLVNTDYTEIISTNYTAEIYPSTEFTDELGTASFLDDVFGTYANKIPAATKFTGEVNRDTDFLEEVLKGTDFTDVDLKNTVTDEDLIKQARESIEYADEVADEFTSGVLSNTDIIKEAFDKADFTIKDLDLGESDYLMDVNENKCTEVDLQSIETKLLKCLKCGIDFDNDIDLHTHLCGGEMTLFLDFQDM